MEFSVLSGGVGHKGFEPKITTIHHQRVCMYTVFVNHLDQEALKTRSACSLMASLRYMGSSYLGDWNVDEWGTYTLFSAPLVCIMYCATRVKVHCGIHNGGMLHPMGIKCTLKGRNRRLNGIWQYEVDYNKSIEMKTKECVGLSFLHNSYVLVLNNYIVFRLPSSVP